MEGFDLISQPNLKEEVLRALMDSLAESNLQNTKPQLWAFQVKLVLNMARKLTPEQERRKKQLLKGQELLPLMASPLSAQIRQSFVDSSNLTLQLYAQTDEELHVPFSAPYFNN